MKTKSFFLIVFLFVLALGAGCKKKVEPVEAPPPPPPPKTDLVEFIRDIGDLPEVKNLELGETVNVRLNPEKILSPPAEFAVVERFKSEWGYSELIPVNDEIPLTIVWGKPGSRLLVLDPKKDLRGYEPEDRFTVLDPKPEYLVKVGERRYWVTSGGNFWKTR